MNRKILSVLGIALIGIVLSGCKETTNETTKEARDASELSVKSVPEAVDLSEDVSDMKLGPGLQRLADLAMADLATRFAIDKEKISVVEAEYVTWRDASTGCPRPGMQYAQVLTNGSRIVLMAEGKRYHYHSGGNRPPVYCARPSGEKPLPYQYGET